MNSKMQEKVKA